MSQELGLSHQRTSGVRAPQEVEPSACLRLANALWLLVDGSLDARRTFAGHLAERSEPLRDRYRELSLVLFTEPDQKVLTSVLLAVHRSSSMCRELLPAVLPLLHHPSRFVASAATKLVGNLGSEAALVAPSLFVALHRKVKVKGEEKPKLLAAALDAVDRYAHSHFSRYLEQQETSREWDLSRGSLAERLVNLQLCPSSFGREDAARKIAYDCRLLAEYERHSVLANLLFAIARSNLADLRYHEYLLTAVGKIGHDVHGLPQYLLRYAAQAPDAGMRLQACLSAVESSGGERTIAERALAIASGELRHPDVGTQKRAFVACGLLLPFVGVESSGVALDTFARELAKREGDLRLLAVHLLGLTRECPEQAARLLLQHVDSPRDIPWAERAEAAQSLATLALRTQNVAVERIRDLVQSSGNPRIGEFACGAVSDMSDLERLHKLRSELIPPQ